MNSLGHQRNQNSNVRKGFRVLEQWSAILSYFQRLSCLIGSLRKMATKIPSAPVPPLGIRVLEARVKNFRSLKLAAVAFDDLTLLIGENNSGKTSFLEALHMAIGQGYRSNFVDDIFLGPEEKQPPKDRTACVDLLIRPVNPDGTISNTFPSGSPWLELWGNGIQQDSADKDFVAIRTVLAWDVGRGEYSISRKFLIDWLEKPADIMQSKVNEKSGQVLWHHIEPLCLYFMDAKRDIHDELHNRGSFWSKMVSDVGLTDEQIAELEIQLSTINDAIVSGSKVLTHIEEHLGELYRTVTCDKESVSITPLSRHLRDFRQGMDVQFATTGSQFFPLSRHGMGTRSLAAVLIFRAYMTWRQKENKDHNALHPMLALEEPEAHLHPQAQRALFSHLFALPGQRIISSHSPYIVSQANIDNVRHFRKNGPETLVSRLDTSSLTTDDIRKIDRMVLNTRGDILFAKAIVLFEGETEEQALPLFAEHYWDRSVHALGLSFVGVGGKGNYLPFLRLAHDYGIPWYIFGDGEADAQKQLAAALKKIGVSSINACPTVFVIPGGDNYERYILNEGYQDAVKQMLDAYHQENSFLKNYMVLKHGQKAKGGVVRDYESAGAEDRAMLDALTEGKTEYGAPLARAIVSLADPQRRIPVLMAEMFKAISSVIEPQVIVADQAAKPGAFEQGKKDATA
jgi:putative ATP-dependent endonuclease of OLD family